MEYTQIRNGIRLKDPLIKIIINKKKSNREVFNINKILKLNSSFSTRHRLNCTGLATPSFEPCLFKPQSM